MTTECPACAKAREHRHSHLYRGDCQGCAARSLARMPAFFESARDGVMTPRYRAALQQMLPKLSAAEAHKEVNSWAT